MDEKARYWTRSFAKIGYFIGTTHNKVDITHAYDMDMLVSSLRYSYD
jgi:hypothetical protein